MTGESPSFAAQLAGTALALAFVLALAWFALRGLKRLQQRAQGAAGTTLQVLASTGLGARERLVAVRWHGREYLLAVTPASVTVVDRRDGPDPGAP